MGIHEIGTAFEDKISIIFVFEQEGKKTLSAETMLQPPRYQGHPVFVYLDIHIFWRRLNSCKLTYQAFLT